MLFRSKISAHLYIKMVQRLNSRTRRPQCGPLSSFASSKHGITYGHNDDMPDDQSGDGFKTFVQGIPNSLTTRPKILNDLLNDKDDVLIKSLYVCRQPIYKIFEMGLNILTLGQLKEQMKRLGYDNLYHLYLIINFEDGSQHFIEKNQRVNTGKYVKQDEEECTQPIPFNKTLKDLIETAEARRIPGFYRYNAFSDNCQRFAYDVMNSNGIDQFNG